MKFKTLALGGAAIVGLALATPAIAFTHHPSTPAEDKQTDDLNAQQLAKAQQSSTTTVAGASSTTMPSNTQAASAPATSEGAPAVEGASTTQSPNDKQASNTAEGPQAATSTVTLAQIANPPQTLVNASVETNNGQAVGAVQKVVTGTDGKAQALDVALLGAQSKIVAIDANQLSYDQSRNVVVAQLSADQIQALPAAPQG
ncbi:MAG: hypothetical protein JOZ72_13505 [Alphaproteobacteria bacterium]|nr:hypothetical protein [Alphaproteobacteria bacterium]